MGASSAPESGDQFRQFRQGLEAMGEGISSGLKNFASSAKLGSMITLLAGIATLISACCTLQSFFFYPVWGHLHIMYSMLRQCVKNLRIRVSDRL